MKLEKGYTSQGFGFYLKSLTTSEFCKLSGAEQPKFITHASAYRNALEFHRVDAVKLRLRDDWDKYLLQPLKKEMFVNEIEKPTEPQMPTTSGWQYYQRDLKEWQEAEKKVIFKGWKKSTYHKYQVVNGLDIITFANADYPKLLDSGEEITVQTIGDLFQATNGELTVNIQL